MIPIWICRPNSRPIGIQLDHSPTIVNTELDIVACCGTRIAGTSRVESCQVGVPSRVTSCWLCERTALISAYLYRHNAKKLFVSSHCLVLHIDARHNFRTALRPVFFSGSSVTGRHTDDFTECWKLDVIKSISFRLRIHVILRYSARCRLLLNDGRIAACARWHAYDNRLQRFRSAYL